MTKGIFITGTGTDVGKTYAAGLLLKKLRESGRNAGYYKAAASGNERLEDGTIAAGDAREICRLSGLPDRPESLISYLYETAVSPHLAAKLEGGPVSLEKVAADFTALSRRFDVLVAEGSGGIVCPIRWDDRERILLEDVIHALALPIVIVADAGLGTINHTVLTVAYARSKGLDPRGMILLTPSQAAEKLKKNTLFSDQELNKINDYAWDILSPHINFYAFIGITGRF